MRQAVNLKFKTEARRRGALKSTLRRNPCRLIFISNIIFLLLLLTTLYVGVKFYEDFNEQLEIFANEEKIIENLGQDVASLAECSFELHSKDNSTKLYMNTSKCKNYRRGEGDQYALSRKLTRIQLWNVTKFDVPPLCHQIEESMDCHESFPATATVSKDHFRTSITQCIGLVDSYPFDNSIDQNEIWAPAIDDSTLLEHYKDKIVFSNDLVLRCPVCFIESDPFTFDDMSETYIKLSTIKRGWPVNYEFCKSTTNVTLPSLPALSPAMMLIPKIDEHEYVDEVNLVTEAPMTTPDD